MPSASAVLGVSARIVAPRRDGVAECLEGHGRMLAEAFDAPLDAPVRGARRVVRVRRAAGGVGRS